MTRSSWEDDAKRLRRLFRRRFPSPSEPPPSILEAPESAPTVRQTTVDLRRSALRPALFDYQRELGEAMLALAESGGRGLVSLPTGAGKTRTAASAVLEALGNSAIRQAVWMAPTVELIDQAFRTFESLWRNHGTAPDITLTRSGVTPRESTVWLTTPQSVYRQIQRGRNIGAWDLVVFDEAHQLAARTYRAAVEALTESTTKAALVGLSATPGRVDESETEELVSLFDGNLLTSSRLRPNPVEVLQRRGVLARLSFRSLTTRELPPEAEQDRLEVVMRAAEELARRGGRVLVFAGSVAGAVVLAELLPAQKVRAEAVHADMDMTARFGAIDAFADGRLQVLTNQRLLATGYDCPAVSDVIICAPVGSPILFEQIVGRAARGPRTGGLSEANVWEFDNHLLLHGLPQSYYRFRYFDWT